MGDKRLPKEFPLIKNGMPHNLDESSVTMEQWLGEPPDFERIDEEISADVIILGAGVAGICAARSAVENGASAVLFEKSDGPRARSGDIAVIGSKREKEWWGRDNTVYTEEIINDFMRDLGWRPNYRTIKFWAYNNGAAFDWFMQGEPGIHVQKTSNEPVPADCTNWVHPHRLPLNNSEWKPSDEYIGTYPVTLNLAPSLMPVLVGNYQIAKKTGKLKTFFNTPAKKLLRGDDGRIRGVIAENYNTSNVYQCNAKSVIIATGGFSGDREMLYYYIPWAFRDTNALHLLQDPDSDCIINNGDGHKMGIWAGAAMEDGPLGLVNHCLGGIMGCNSFLNLNIDGERFMNEDVPGQEWEHAVSRQRQACAYQILDAGWSEQVPLMAPEHGSQYGIAPDLNYENPIQQLPGYIGLGEVEESCGPETKFHSRTVKADTLEELVDQLELDDSAKAQALKSINRYNELAKTGIDEDFGKTEKRLFPIEKAPFYASKFSTAELLNTVGGLDCDHEGRVLDATRRPIPGLYAAGNTQGGRFPSHYPIIVPGISHSMCITYGRQTGLNAAEYSCGDI